MATHSDPSEQFEGSANQRKLLADEMETAQSRLIVEQLPTLIAANGVWALACCFVVGYYGSWPFSIMSLIVIFLISTWIGYKKPGFLKKIFSSKWLANRRFATHAGLIGIFWGIGMLIYLPNLPFNMLCVLMTGFLILMYWVVDALHQMPSAGIAYLTPISLAGLYICSPPYDDARKMLVTFIGIVAGTSIWTLKKRQRFFLKYINLAVERNHFSNVSRSAISSRDQFLENVSHEIKTPLTTILGYTRLLAAENYKAPNIHEKTLDHLEVSALALLRSIDVLLDLAKLNAGKLELQENIINIRSTVQKAVNLVRLSAENKNIDIKISFSSDIPKTIFGDSDRVDQIISNLLGNAIKFTESGHVCIDVICDYPVSSLGQEKALCIAITDTGIGIDVSKHSSIFRSFYQVDGSVARRHGGMGLGLAVSKMLANLMDGDLIFESDGHSGSTFKCWLPIRTKIEDAVEKNTSILGLRNHDENWHILVVDDDMYIRHYLQILLSADGWVVELCESGFSAIVKCLEKKYDLILMDIQMPVMTGIDASKIIWSSPINDRTPILVMTSYLSTDRIMDLKSAGLFYFLGKPLVPEELLEKVKHMVLSSTSSAAMKSYVDD